MAPCKGLRRSCFSKSYRMRRGGARRTHISGDSGLAPTHTRRAISGAAHRQWDHRSGSPVPDEPSSCRRHTHQRAYLAHLRDRWGSWMADHLGTPSVGCSFLRSCLARSHLPLPIFLEVLESHPCAYASKGAASRGSPSETTGLRSAVSPRV